MTQYILTLESLAALCKDGDVDGVQKYVETLPSLPKERQTTFYSHFTPISNTCDELPCTASIINLSNTAAQGGQVHVFVYLWDTCLAPRGITSISWPCLKTAAFQGSIPLAQAYWSRDPDCFNKLGPVSVHPPGVRSPLQVETAIRSDRFGYIDFMLAHGANINAGFFGNDIHRMVVRCAADDATTSQRIQFLTSRGVRAAGSEALRELIATNTIGLATCLLDGGADIDDIVDPERTSSLMVAASEGFKELVQILLDRGANTELVDREGRDARTIADDSGHVNIVKLLQAHEFTVKAYKGVT